MIRVKVCGITNLDDALAACDAGADALGFVFAEEAKARQRYIDPDEAQKIIEQLPPFVTTVAVCVNDPYERLVEYLEIVDRVQLHGEETPEVCQQLGRHNVIKACRLWPGFAPRTMLSYPASAYLVDTYHPNASGGTGQTGDWAVACEVAQLTDALILAGGLTPENVADAIEAVQPYAVDVSSGVQSRPGKKDHEQIRNFIRNARSVVSERTRPLR